MKIGKLPESVLARSVLKQIGHRREDVLLGPALGVDCAAVRPEEGYLYVLSADPITGTTHDMGRHCIHVTANDLAASGAEPVGVMLTLLLPPQTEEAGIREIMAGAEAECRSLGMEILGGHTEVTGAVNQPVISVTGLGRVREADLLDPSRIREGQDLVLTKWIGLEATAILAKEKTDYLLKRFSPDLVNRAGSFGDLLSVLPEARLACAYGVTAMHDVTEGGVFGALWEMAESGKTGLEVDVKKIPIRQETVEICEYMGLNPYQIMSSGSMMIVCDDGEGLVHVLAQNGIHACRIGRTTGSRDRLLLNGEEVRYLDKPQTDEIYKIYLESDGQDNV